MCMVVCDVPSVPRINSRSIGTLTRINQLLKRELMKVVAVYIVVTAEECYSAAVMYCICKIILMLVAFKGHLRSVGTAGNCKFYVADAV